MSNKQIEALKLALEALEQWNTPLYKRKTAITAIREALAEQPAQQRPQNCGTGFCSCIECPYEQPAQEPKKDLMWSSVAMQERHEQYVQRAVATLERVKQEQLAEQPAQQQGWKLVPVQPTDEMRDAGNAIIGDRGALFAAYRAMLNAAPQPAQQEPVAYDKTEINCFAQDLYDQKMREGKRGHYESMFHVIHQCINKVSPPASKPWVSLTNEEKMAALVSVDAETKRLPPGFRDFAHAIEAKLKEKNNG